VVTIIGSLVTWTLHRIL